ncbi:MAG TPA: hypothetical protein ENJ95_15095 [Bacteroidetes bacterium]|nr:hypothetical protein [Bacteroidota bacterium]
MEENIDIELAEAFSLTDILLSNLATVSDGKQLITDGMIYFNATSNGEQLKINKNNPIYIEIPTDERKPDMQAYKGERDENGNINWVDPKKLETFLNIVDLGLLDFYPKGFEAEVEAHMPYKGHEYASKELKDSLFYSLSFDNLIRMNELEKNLPATGYNEPYYNKNKQVVDGKYTADSYETEYEHGVDSAYNYSFFQGIDPVLIKTIRSKPFQNTLIATREFEKRLAYIYESCHNSILEIYSKNLDKNMWELDMMAADYLNSRKIDPDAINSGDKMECSPTNLKEIEQTFRNFSSQKLTNVKGGKKYATLLKGYYEKRLKEVRKELESKQKEFLQKRKKENEEVKKVTEEYKKLLFKREKYRMETYGFEWTNTGWINIDTGTIPKTWGRKGLEVFVKNGSEYDQVYTYVIYSSIKSLYRLNTADKETFFAGNNSDREMLMPKKKQATIISIAYKEEKIFLGKQDFITGNPSVVINLFSSSKTEIEKALKRYDNYSPENNIGKDLQYMAFFAKEQNRQKELLSEIEFTRELFITVYSECYCGSGN